jgi:hypothetical protein
MIPCFLALDNHIPQYLGWKLEVTAKLSCKEELWSHELLIYQVVPANKGKT